MNKRFFRTEIQQLLFLFLLVTISNAGISQQEDNDSVYLLKKDWTITDNINKAIYFFKVVHENDTTYVCRYYNKSGSMVRQESFFDAALTIPNGRFCWYDKDGMLDSTGLVYRKRKTGSWIYYDDDAKSILSARYNNGVLIEKKNYYDRTGLFEDTAANKQWKAYLQKTILVPERFISITRNGSCQVIVSFTVNSEGKATDIYLEHSCEWSADNEVFKAVRNGPILRDAYEHEDSINNAFRDTVIFYSVINLPYDLVKKNVVVGTQVQMEAKFPGGMQAWNRFLERNLNTDVPVSRNAPPGEYPVTVSFLVEEDGTVGEVEAINDPGYGTAEEAVRVFKKSPKWTPATQNGVPVIYRQKQSLTFYVSQN